MKKVKIKVSKQGLTRCPSCKAHIQVASPLGDTVCPFCQSALAGALATRSEDPGPLSRLMGQGRGALIAASLLGVPAMGACDSNEGSSADVAEPAADIGEPVADAADVPVASVLYGMPPEPPIDAGPAPDVVVEADTEGDALPPDEPVYGMPPESPGE